MCEEGGVFVCICEVSTVPLCFIYNVQEQVSRAEGSSSLCMCVKSGRADKSATPHKLLQGVGQPVNYSSHTGTTDAGPWLGAGPAASGCSVLIKGGGNRRGLPSTRS